MTLLHEPTRAEFTEPEVTYEPLSPFLVPCSAAEILSTYPELEPVCDIPVDLFEDVILKDESLKLNGVNREERRRNGLDPELHLAAKEAYLAVAHILAGIQDPGSRPEAYQDLIREWEESRGVRAGSATYLHVALEHMQPSAGVAFIEAVNAHARPIQDRLWESVSDSRASQYQLLKSLVSVQSKEIVDEFYGAGQSKDFQTLRWLNVMALVKADGKQAPIYDRLRQSLEGGDFDRYIAYDMLEYARHYEGNGHTPDDVAAMKRLVRLGESAAGAPADSQMAARLAEAEVIREQWSKEQQAVISKQRKFLSEEWTDLYVVVSDFAHDAIAVNDRNYPYFVRKNFDKLAGLKSFHHIQTARGMGEAATASTLNPKKRRAEPINEQVDESERKETESSAEKEPLSIKFLDSNGILHGADSPQFQNFIDDYLRRHSDSPYVKDDVDRMLEYLSLLDFSNGGVTGLIRINDGFIPVLIDGNLKNIPLWEFKPKKAKGLSLKSNTATNTRLFFCMPPGNSIGLVDIERRTSNKNRHIRRPRGRPRRRH